MERIFDPSYGTGSTLVATSTSDYTSVLEAFEQDQMERENSRRLRDMRELGFGARASYCG
jgi:hypothetical protein